MERSYTCAKPLVIVPSTLLRFSYLDKPHLSNHLQIARRSTDSIAITHDDARDSIWLFNKRVAEKPIFEAAIGCIIVRFALFFLSNLLSFLQIGKVVSSSGITKCLIVAIYMVVIR